MARTQTDQDGQAAQSKARSPLSQVRPYLDSPCRRETPLSRHTRRQFCLRPASSCSFVDGKLLCYRPDGLQSRRCLADTRPCTPLRMMARRRVQSRATKGSCRAALPAPPLDRLSQLTTNPLLTSRLICCDRDLTKLVAQIKGRVPHQRLLARRSRSRAAGLTSGRLLSLLSGRRKEGQGPQEGPPEDDRGPGRSRGVCSSLLLILTTRLVARLALTTPFFEHARRGSFMQSARGTTSCT